jgi:hypothetical protein
MLRSCDRFVIDNHSVQDVIKWPLRRKKAAVEYLERLHKIYCGELKTETASYRDIASYFIRKPALDTTPAPLALASSNDTSLDKDQTRAASDKSSSSSSSDDESDVPIRRRSAPGAGISSRALRSPRKGVILARALLK